MDSSGSDLIMGKNIPWKRIAGHVLRLQNLVPFAEVVGGRVGKPTLGAYGLATVELANPDVQPEERMVMLAIKDRHDYASLMQAELDPGVKGGRNEIVLLYERNRGFLGAKKPSIHVAIYPAGTWRRFYEAAAKWRGFEWPEALAAWQPGKTQVFPARTNLFIGS